MTDNYLKIERTRQKLVDSYNSLPELDRAIVQLISVIYRPVSRTIILELLNETELCGDKRWIALTLKPYLDRFIANDLLIPNRQSSV